MRQRQECARRALLRKIANGPDTTDVRTTERPGEYPRHRLAGAHYGETIRAVDFSSADLASISTPALLWLERCLFASADLRHATLNGCHFKLCDLRGANLRGASLRGVSFAGCDLTGADLRDTDLLDTHFGAVGAGRGAKPTRLEGAQFSVGVVPCVDAAER